MKSGEKFSRKEFLKTILLAGIAIPFLQYCSQKAKGFLLKITGTNHVLGHRLWAKNFPKYSEEISVKYFIAGAGISGLSAARYFIQNDENDFLICEMENRIGGNSSNGQNRFSKFPLGAHYLPLPNKENKEIIEFLRESGLYLGDDENGFPILDDEQLVFPQDERLFFKNSWQNDLVPQKGISENTKKEFERFFGLMDAFRVKKDNSGKYWFDIPIQNSSNIEDAKKLDTYTFEKWLSENHFSSEELLWFLDYSCRDDYGLGIRYVSAWAGIHYFAGRKNNWATNHKEQVFTWPEGNARLTKHLQKHSQNKILKKHLVFDVRILKDKVQMLAFDDSSKKTIKILAEKVLLATPQFVNKHIIKDRKIKPFNYVPWLLATLTLRNEFGGEEELAWDNVIYGTEGLGYIYDQHQNLSQNIGEKVITYYRSFSTENCDIARKKLFRMKDEDLKKIVLNDLKTAHPRIEDFILEIDFHIIGHAMIAPVPNQIFGKETEKAQQNIEEKIYFAHSDLSGISIFEEAFHQGITAAKQMMK